MEFIHETTGARFVISDKVTVRQQLEYFSASIAQGKTIFERYWLAAVPLIKEWKFELMPKVDTSLDDVSDPNITAVIIWAGLEVKKHLDRLGEVPKN